MLASTNVDYIKKEIEDQGHTVIIYGTSRGQALITPFLFHIKLNREGNNKDI
jgi:hypothetical protein